MRSVPLEGFSGMPTTVRQAPTTSGIQQASPALSTVDLFICEHSGGDDEERGEAVLATVFWDLSCRCLL